ncbi:MAG: hypothetical protein QM754_18085 [Tepidisphaeraceae bacterium]
MADSALQIGKKVKRLIAVETVVVSDVNRIEEIERVFDHLIAYCVNPSLQPRKNTVPYGEEVYERIYIDKESD